MSQVEHAALIGDGFLGAPLRMRFQPRCQDVGRARHWFRTCLRQLPTVDADAAEAVFAEVAANAVRHGRGRVTVTVEFLGTAVRCAIRDGGWRVPQLTTAWRPDLEDGRGMVIIEALADRWGVRRHLLGKTVWFEIRVPARARSVRPGPALRSPARTGSARTGPARTSPARTTPGLTSAAFAKTALPPR
jgi:anti-sigma regulatory factor (Ser/Thr protein kinase)